MDGVGGRDGEADVGGVLPLVGGGLLAGGVGEGEREGDGLGVGGDVFLCRIGVARRKDATEDGIEGVHDGGGGGWG